jgi:hypothetical protein
MLKLAVPLFFETKPKASNPLAKNLKLESRICRDAGLAAVKLSHTAQHRLWERLKLLLPYLDGRHTLEEISALSKVRSTDVSAIASLCPDFLLCVRCAV